MKIVISANSAMSFVQAFAKTLDKFDPLFSQRYLINDNSDGFEYFTIQGEKHWDSDKYHILYLECDDHKLLKLLDEMQKNENCNLIAETDEQYNVVGKALYVKPNILQAFYQQKQNIGTDYRIPQNVLRREAGFMPKLQPNTE